MRHEETDVRLPKLQVKLVLCCARHIQPQLHEWYPCTTWRSALLDKLLVVSYVFWHDPIVLRHAHLIHILLNQVQLVLRFRAFMIKLLYYRFLIWWQSSSLGRKMLDFSQSLKVSLALIASSDDNFMRDIWNINNLLSHRDTELKFFEFSVLRQLSGLCSGS